MPAGPSTARRRTASLFGMIKNTHQQSPAHTLSAYKDNAAVIEGSDGKRFFADPKRRRVARRTRARRLRDQGGDAQPSHRDRAMARRRHRRRRRDPRRGRHRPRRQAEGRPDRASRCRDLRIPGHAAAVGSGASAAAAHGQRVRDHARWPARRRRVQQRIRPARAWAAISAPSRANCRAGRFPPRLRQADHACRRPGQHPRRPRAEARAAARSQGDRARWPGDADRPGRRCRLVGGLGRLQRRARLRLGAARQRRDGAPLPAGHRQLLGARRRTIPSSASTTSARAACPTPFRRCSTTPASAAISTCRRFPATTRRCRRCRCGATSRRSATCSRSPPTTCRIRALLRSASAARSRWWVTATAERQLVLRDPRRDLTVIDLPMDVLFGKAPRMHRDATRVHAAHRPGAGPVRHRHGRSGAARAAPADRGLARASSSPSVTAPSAASTTATRWSARGRCRWPIAR